jgi:hypothetical protein
MKIKKQVTYPCLTDRAPSEFAVTVFRASFENRTLAMMNVSSILNQVPNANEDGKRVRI